MILQGRSYKCESIMSIHPPTLLMKPFNRPFGVYEFFPKIELSVELSVSLKSFLPTIIITCTLKSDTAVYFFPVIFHPAL